MRAYGVALAVNVSEIEKMSVVNECDSWQKGCECICLSYTYLKGPSNIYWPFCTTSNNSSGNVRTLLTRRELGFENWEKRRFRGSLLLTECESWSCKERNCEKLTEKFFITFYVRWYYLFTLLCTHDYYLMLILPFKLTHLPTYQHYLYPELGLSLEVKTV